MRSEEIMRIDQLMYFLEVVKAGSIKAASQNINISHQALSQSMAAMENELGVEIFRRGKNGVELTDYGAKAFATANKICFAWNNLLGETARIKEVPEKLKIGFTTYMEINYYSKILNYLQSNYIQVHPSFVILAPDMIVSEILTGNLDFAILGLREDSLEEFLQKAQKIEICIIKNLELDLLVNRNCGLAKLKQVGFEDLSGETLISEKCDSYTEGFFLNSERKQDINLVRVNSLITAQEMAAKNQGVAIYSNEYPLFDEFKNKIVRKKLVFEKQPIGSICMIYLKGKENDEVIASIKNFISTK